MEGKTEEELIDHIGALLGYIQDNGAEISGLKKMMTEVVKGMDDLTARVEQLEKGGL